MQQPSLVILAAGMGSRFGGLKQIMSIDDYGHAIIDYSLYDAYRAGFRKIAFIIKHEIEDDFKAAIGKRMEKYFDVSYVYQQLDVLPDGYSVPDGRIKPWGTGHAVLCCRGAVDGPFAVINADDYYGVTAFKALYDFLSKERASNEHAMVAYHLQNTVPKTGHVARGICEIENDMLTDVIERTHIQRTDNGFVYEDSAADAVTFIPVHGESAVSMNCWAFGNSILDELYSRFPAWLDENLSSNPEKCEYFLPSVVNSVIKENKGSVQVLKCTEKWYGMTYKEDMQDVVAAFKSMRNNGIYPEKLFD